MMNDLGLYVHIPFCQARCHYCDFVSLCPRPGDIDNYLGALEKELLGFDRLFDRSIIETIYIGGGTPSILNLDQTGRLLEMLQPLRKAVTEFTIEANPESVSDEKVRLWHDHGIDRVSLGMQTSDPLWLKTLGRIHTAEKVAQAVDIIRQRIDCLNIDLIYGLAPGDKTYMKTLEEIIGLRPQHISIYELEVYDHLPLAKMLSERVDSDESFEQFHRLMSRLESAGYQRYEVSNFSLPGFEAKHNQRYWKRQNTLGVGLGAHSLIDNKRFNNTADLTQYLAGERIEHRENLSSDEALLEEIMLGLRRVKGMNYRNLIKQYPDRSDMIDRFVQQQIQLDRLILTDDCLKATQLGLDLLDRIVLDFMSLQ